MQIESDLERKFSRFGETLKVTDGVEIEGYASLFGLSDQGGDVVLKGAYAKSLEKLKEQGQHVKMLWQHDASEPIGVWDAVHEDDKGLYVKGRLLEGVARGREAAALIVAGALDGLSIGYRTKKAKRDTGGLRQLEELELWEVSLVTFPMLASARVGSKSGDLYEEDSAGLRDIASVLRGMLPQMQKMSSAGH
ncbi:HK97 family phage prohead protease [Planktotalea sp.]|uniref:HK97 family phage prohead protease n=1 Tax=Planktotalea sp. TaxID=2029877 RepID=UPI003F6D2834